MTNNASKIERATNVGANILTLVFLVGGLIFGGGQIKSEIERHSKDIEKLTSVAERTHEDVVVISRDIAVLRDRSDRANTKTTAVAVNNGEGK